MKKNMFLAAAAVVALASCNNASPKMDEQPAAAAAGESTGNVKIAYVEVDSLMTQYEFCKEFTLILQKKSTNARNTLNQKGQALQNAAANFQQKLQNNGFTSREQAESQQAAIQRQQQSLQETHCSTSWQHIIRIRSMTSSSPSRVTTSCMLPSASTSLTMSSTV